MKSQSFKTLLLSVFLITAPVLAKANVIYPALDVQNDLSAASTDTGADYNPGNFLNVDSSVLGIVLDDGFIEFDPYEDFQLNVTYNGSEYTGSFTAGTLLSGDITMLTTVFNGGGIEIFPGVFTANKYTFDADFTFTGGSLAGSATTGTMTGTLDSDGEFIAKVGTVTVVPVPAAVWLFASGLLGLVGVARRKTA